MKIHTQKLLATVAFSIANLATPAFASLVFFNGNIMSLQGSAKMVGTDLQLNWGTGEVSSAWLLKPVSTANSFTAEFTFSLQSHDNGFLPSGDGFAFAMQAWSNSALGRGGGDVGYGGIFGRAVGSVVQTWDNCRIGLDTTGNPFNAPAAPVRREDCALIKNGTQTLRYDADTHLLSLVGVFSVFESPGFVLTQSVEIDLAARFGPLMYAGFTGGTGIAQSDQRIRSFRFSVDEPDPGPSPGPNPLPTPVSEPNPLALLALGLGLVSWTSHRRKMHKVDE